MSSEKQERKHWSPGIGGKLKEDKGRNRRMKTGGKNQKIG